MPGDARNWQEVARGKLVRVLGAEAGERLMVETLAMLGLPELRTANELRQFALALCGRGNFPAAIGAMLDLHATIHDR